MMGRGNLSMEEYHHPKVPRYTILSHTWGAEEVTFKDLMEDTGKDKIGYREIEFCRKQSIRDDVSYFWVDTCCIDKSSDAELTEAINSMFRCYQNATLCYVYLADVSTSSNAPDAPDTTWEAAFRESRWFRRGWMLQELIAPTIVEYFSQERECPGSKRSLEQQIHKITGIAVRALRDSLEDLRLKNVSIGQRIARRNVPKTRRNRFSISIFVAAQGYAGPAVADGTDALAAIGTIYIFPAVGFYAVGFKAGSIAASVQASIYGAAVPAGGRFARLQSWGAMGALAGMLGAAALLVEIIVAGGTYTAFLVRVAYSRVTR